MFHIQIPDYGICLISRSQIPDLISNSQITEAKWFEIFILLAITGTCVSLAVSIFLHPAYQHYHVMRVMYKVFKTPSIFGFCFTNNVPIVGNYGNYE